MSGITDAILGRWGFSGPSAKVILTDSAETVLGTNDKGIPVVDANIVPVEYAQNSSLTIVRPMWGTNGIWASEPAGNPTIALLQAIGYPIRWRDDGTDPSVTTGMILPVNDQFLYTGDLSAIKFIRADATETPELNVTLYKQA